VDQAIVGLKIHADAQDAKPVGGGVGEVVGRGVDERVGLEAEGAADTAGARVAGGKDVGVGVADHDGLRGGDGAPGDCSGLGDEGLEAVWVGLLGVEAVAAVVLEEEAREAEVGTDVAGWVDGFVG
jgi:hypothetical protein